VLSDRDARLVQDRLLAVAGSSPWDGLSPRSGVSDLLCKGSVGLRGTRWTLWLMNRLRRGQMSLRS